MEGILVLLALGMLLGSLFGWISLFKLSNTRQELRFVQQRLDKLTDTLLEIKDRQSGASKSSVAEPDTSQSDSEEATPPPTVVEAAASSDGPVKTATPEWKEFPEPPPKESIAESVDDSEPSEDRAESDFAAKLKEQWMVWLGGICIGLAGIFMVRYSIEQGLLGPTARIALGIITGLILHGVAEFGRQRSMGTYQALAALAGGASLMLYSALVAGLLLYELFPPLLVFVALAIVSLATMYLSLLHGPVLAILGILGAYIVPVLVDTGSSNIVGLFVYSSIISLAAVWLMRFVYRDWLWASIITGAMAWWYMALVLGEGEGIRGLYITFLAYLFVAIPSRDWLVRKSDSQVDSQFDSAMLKILGSYRMSPLVVSLLTIVVAACLTIVADENSANAQFQWLPLVLLLLLLGGSRDSLRYIPLFALLLLYGTWLFLGAEFTDGIQLVGLPLEATQHFLIHVAAMTFLYFALAMRNARKPDTSEYWFALGILAPLGWVAVSYLLVSDFSDSVVWGGATVLVGVVYLGIASWRLKGVLTATSANSESGDGSGFVSVQHAIWLLLAGHFAYSLAVAIMVQEAGLTLALAAQVLSLSWIINRFEANYLSILLKVVIGIVVTRLTLNPWMLTYADVSHWSLWTFGGSTLLCAAAAWQLKNNFELRTWLEAAALHLFVLTAWSEIRYQLYDGQVFARDITLLEMTLNMVPWSSLALVYHYRRQVSHNLKRYYQFASYIVLGLSVIAYFFVLFPMNPLWGQEELSSTPIFNLMLLSYGFPILIAVLIYKYYDPALKKYASVFAGLAGFIFITLQIRHLWQGDLYINRATSNGELYTYSIVWLLLAIGCLLGGSIRFGKSVYNAGFGLLMLVIAKIFLIDMSDLEGLLRVASFMGLGLSLLGLAYLYQRFELNRK